MRAHVLWLCAVCACTQDFGQFDPLDASAPDATGDSSAPDAAPDAAVDVAVDVAADVAKDAPADVGANDAAPDVGPVDAATDAPVACTETGAILYAGHCYFLVSGAQDFNTAKTACTNAGAHLVTITTAGEQAAVIALGTGTERWMGLFRNGGAAKDGFYAWITGEGRNGFSAWSPNEPNGTGQCGALLGTGLWNDENCALSLASICERE